MISTIALITWLLTVAGGLYLLATWLVRGGLRQQRTMRTRLPTPLVFGHVLLALAGLVVWAVHVSIDRPSDRQELARLALIILLPVVGLGFAMLFRWLPVRRARIGASSPGTPARPPKESANAVPAERGFPVAVVFGHGMLAMTTLVLVLLAILHVGGD